MKKQYRLIKKYPGSPKLDTIIELETAVNGQIVQGKWCYDIDKTPEFWEEVVEKDYEILYILGTDNKIIPYLTKTECINYLIHSGFKIYSVKRLSDGEIFTIGDKIKGYNNSGIKEFKLESFGLRVITDANGNGCVTDKLSWKLEDCIKSKQPLFTTEDGVDMYVGNKYYSINANLQENIQELFATKDTIKSCFYRYFSTKESAKEYIILNKPCLSINDVFEHTQMFNLGKWGEALKELVKSKLNQ